MTLTFLLPPLQESVNRTESGRFRQKTVLI